MAMTTAAKMGKVGSAKETKEALPPPLPVRDRLAASREPTVDIRFALCWLS